ncbi:hypothetical protein EBU99_00580 [bacterium]|nr:hypothetical protein [bacterium]
MSYCSAGRTSSALKCALATFAIVLATVPAAAYSGQIQQTTATFPVSKNQLPRQARLSPLAEQAPAGFALLPAVKGGAALQTIRHRIWSNDTEAASVVLPVCGQAADLSTLGCYNLVSGESLADIPIPGQVTTVPQFHDGSWYVGTSRGFFVRIDANGPFLTPSFGIDSQLLHGPDARVVMKSLASSASLGPIDRPDTSIQSMRFRFRGAWQWYATANAEFIGTPQFGFGQVFVLTANQSLNAYDLITGKLNWGVRLAPDAQLRLASTSLVLHEKGVIAGTSDGYLMVLDPKNGQPQIRLPLASASSDRFPAIAAPALAMADGVVVSNAESLTQKINWESKAVEWSFGVGSVAQPKYDEGAVFIAGSDGAIHKVDSRTGQLRWSRSLPTNNPLIALTLLKKQDMAIAASSNGSLFAVRLSSGEWEGSSDTSSFGAVVGDFFAGRTDLNEVCLSYRTPGFACWTWLPTSRFSYNAK